MRRAMLLLFGVMSVTAHGALRVWTLAGSTRGGGVSDGAGSDARFSAPAGVAVCSNGDIFVSDTGNHAIRRVTPGGVVTTFATGFNKPRGITADASCNLYVADSNNHAIRRIAPDGTVTTFAGQLGVSGSSDGNRTSARFSTPTDVAFDNSGTLYVADSKNHKIRSISPGGAVTTVATPPSTFNEPTSVIVDAAGTIYVGDTWNFSIRKIAGGNISKVTTNGDAYLVDFTLGADGAIYVSDYQNHTISRIGATTLDVIAGAHRAIGAKDGSPLEARFQYPSAIATAPDGSLIVTESGNHDIRRVTASGVSTLAGVAPESGFADGPAGVARFNRPSGITVDDAGIVYVTDLNGARRIERDGTTSTLSTAFKANSIAVDANGNLYAAQFISQIVQKLSTDGTITTFGLRDTMGDSDGNASTARFRFPRGPKRGPDGAIYFADAGNNKIRRIDAAGNVTTFASNVRAGVNIEFDPDGNLYVVSEFDYELIRITPAGVKTVVSPVTGFNRHEPRIARGADGSFYIVDTPITSVRRITNNTTEAAIGADETPGNVNGPASIARLSHPVSIASGPDGRLYIADAGNHAVRVVSFTDPATILTFTATPFTGTSTLQWQTTGGTHATITPDIGDVPLSGSITVSPQRTTTYVLTVTGEDSEAVASVRVLMNGGSKRRSTKH